MLALHFGLLPDALQALAADELVADIERRDLHLSTGFVGAPYLPHVLSAHGKKETAFKLLAQTSWPSWVYSVMQGGNDHLGALGRLDGGARVSRRGHELV